MKKLTKIVRVLGIVKGMGNAKSVRLIIGSLVV